MSASDYGLDLKPCPLCGGKATLRCFANGHSDVSVFREFKIVCDECGLKTRSARMTATVTPYGTFKLDDDEMAKLLSQWDWRKDEQTNNDTSGTLPEEGD